MSVAFLNDATVRDFVNDTKTFESCVTETFKKLDTNHDGYLVESKLRIGWTPPLAFESADPDDSADDFFNFVHQFFAMHKLDTIDLRDFTNFMKVVMLAMADGIGNLPMPVALEEGSLLMKAVEHEKAKEHH